MKIIENNRKLKILEKFFVIFDHIGQKFGPNVLQMWHF